MAEPEEAPPNIDAGGGLTLDQIRELFGESSEAQREAARIGAEAMLENTRLGQQFVREGADQADVIYSPFQQGGQMWLQRYKDLYDQGAPKYEWDEKFSYPEWEWKKRFEFRNLPEYLKGRFTEEGLRASPNYGLYQFSQREQEDAINKGLRARGLYGSGAGMKKALGASTGLTEKFINNEYARAMGEFGVEHDDALNRYMMDYEQTLQGHNIGYEEAKQKYGMRYDQYLKKYGLDYGQYMDRMNQAQAMGNYAWLGAVGQANARFGAGTQMGAMSQQTGQGLAALQSNLGSGLASTYNAQGNTMAGLYNANQNRTLQQQALNLGQSNYNAYNATNQTFGLANLATGLGRSAWDAYRYYNQPTTYPTLAGTPPVTSYYGDGGMNWTYLD